METQKTKNVKKTAGKTIEVRLINPKRTGTLMVRGIANPNTGEYMPCVDINGEETAFALTKAKTILELNNPLHKAVYEILQVHPVYVNTPYPKVKLVDVETEASDNLDKKDKEFEAMKIIKELRETKLANFARLFNLNMNDSETVLKTRLYSIAQNDPDRILEAFTDPTRELRELIARARSRDIFTTKGGIWYYQKSPMGSNVDAVLNWLLENEDLITVIKKEADAVK